MGSDQGKKLEGSLAIDLVVVLYDGILRFLRAASAAVERGDQAERRIAVKRALDIIIHLQECLRLDVGGRPARVLHDFYASVFAQILQASQSASRQRFEHVIDCVRSVRNAWQEAAHDLHVTSALPRAIAMAARGHGGHGGPDSANTNADAVARSN